MTHDTSTWLIWLGVGYLCGSIPFGLLLGLAQGVDVRKQGSGNVGATNVGRVLGRKWGLICFILDVLKGLGPVLAYALIMRAGGAATGVLQAVEWIAIGGLAVFGHMFPIWLGFKGGKGVATSFGVMLGLWPVLTVPGLTAAALWYIVVALTGYVSLGSIIAAIALPFLAALSAAMLHNTVGAILVYTLVTALLALIVIGRHRGNIRRLLAGTEPRVGWASRKS